MQENQINLMSMTAKGISLCLNQDFNRIETPERMAWIVLLLKRVDDTEEFFPFGKWATIQNIEAQLEKAANHTIHAMRSDGEDRCDCSGFPHEKTCPEYKSSGQMLRRR